MRARSLTLLLLSCVAVFGQQSADRSPLNEHTPSWLTLNAAARFRAEDYRGVDFEEGNERGFLLQRYRFSTGLRLTSWMHAFGELQDAREAGAKRPGAALKDPLDLRQAWVQLGTEHGPWDLTAGRQMLAFGAERVVGAGEWGNTARVFDAVKLGLHRAADRLDVFSSSVVRNDVDGWDHHVDGDNLHGVYGSIRSIAPKATLEPYLFYRTSPSFRGAGGLSGAYNSWTYGFRAAGAGLDRWTYEVELMGQRGDIGAGRLSAWGATVGGRRILSKRRWRPEALVEYNFASGDRNPADSIVQTFDQLYPTNHGKYGITDQLGHRNMKDAKAGLWLHPWQRLTVKAEGHSLWLASRYDGLYSAGGAVSIPAVPGGASSTDVGREVDVLGDLKLSRHYDLGLQVGHLFSGAFVKRYSPGAARTFYTVFLDLHI